MSTNLPLRVLRPLNRQCFPNTLAARPFSSTVARPRRQGQSHVDPAQTKALAENQGGKAPSVAYQEALDDPRNLPDDLGLITDTSIQAPISKLPLLFSRDFFRYEWKILSGKFKGWISLLSYKWRLKAKPYPRVNFFVWDRGHIKHLAKERYKQLYRAFAAGDQRTISRICLSGVAKQFRERISARPPGMRMRWAIDDQSIKTRVVSNRGGPLSLEGYKETGLRQIILRIDSRQTLKVDAGSSGIQQGPPYVPNGPWNPDRRRGGKEFTETKTNSGRITKPVREYLVLQRQMVRGVEDDWKIWGFTQESTLESLAEDEQYQRSLMEYQAE